LTTIPSITPRPTPAPTTADPTNFDARMDAQLLSQATFDTEINLSIAAMNTVAGEVSTSATAASASATAAASSATSAIGGTTKVASSTTSVTLSLAAKAISLVETGRTFTNGERVALVRASDPSSQGSGIASLCVMGGTPATMTITLDTILGSTGPFTDWLVMDAAFVQLLAATATQTKAGLLATVAVTPASLVAAMAFQTLTDAATIAWNMALGVNAKVTITASRAVGLPTNLFDGMSYALYVTQGGVGSFGLTWDAIFDWGISGAPSLSTTAGKTDQCFGQYSAATGKIHMNFRRSA
jgi:hypothetical protein